MQQPPKQGQIWNRIDDERMQKYAIHGTSPLGGSDDIQVVLYQKVDDEGNPEGNVRAYLLESWKSSFTRYIEPWFDMDWS